MATGIVNSIYGVVDATEWNSNRRKTRRNNQLDGNADVLFGVYKPVFPFIREKLHGLLFRPERDPIWWMMIIRKKHENLTVQWTHRQVTEPVRDVINVSGGWEDLEIFFHDFPNYLQEINNNPDKNSPVDEHIIEDLTARIQELAILENRRRRQ